MHEEIIPLESFKYHFNDFYKSHGIGISIINWIEQWLTDRRQKGFSDVAFLTSETHVGREKKG